MDSSTRSCGSPAPFLVKLYDMVDDPSTSCVVSWSNTGCSFVVWNSPEFSRDLLPKYFKHNNFSSFIRQLNTYGFRKVDPDRWEFANCYFIKGKSHLLTKIRRQKPVHSHSGSQGNSIAITVSQRGDFEEQIERLKHEKRSLESTVEKLKFENERYRNQIKLLAQMLINVDPGELESLKRKRKMLAYKDVNPSVILQDNTGFSSPRSHVVEDVDKPDSSMIPWENFGHGMNHTLSLAVKDLSAPSDSIANYEELTTDMAAFSGDSDLNMSRDSCPNIGTSSRHTDSQTISSTIVGSDSKHKFCEMNVKDIKHDEDESIPLPAATNDVFWEQFLTEAPASSIPQDV